MSDYKQPLLGDEASAPPGPPPYNPNLAPREYLVYHTAIY